MKKVNTAYCEALNPNEPNYTDNIEEYEEMEYRYLLSKAQDAINPMLDTWNEEFEMTRGCKILGQIPLLNQILYNSYIYKKLKAAIEFLNKEWGVYLVKLDIDPFTYNIIGRSRLTKRMFYVRFD